MKFDQILTHVGEFGRYQKRIFYPLCIFSFSAAFVNLCVLFLLDIPNHRCSLGENDTYQIQDEQHSHLVNMSIPWETERGKRVPSSCYMYQNTTHVTNETMKCHSWVFDKSTYESTLTEKFSIVCDQRILRSHTNMAAFFGKMFGAPLSGVFADLYGRRPVLLISVMLQAASFISSTFSPTVTVLMVLRAISTLACGGVSTVMYVLTLEMCGPSKRVFTGMVIPFFWCLGLYTMGLAAYFLRNWQTLQLVISMPMILFIGYFWLVPESPRWLISRHRMTEAQTVIRKMASVNKVELHPGILENIQSDEKAETVKLTEWFTSRPMIVMTLIIFFNWFVISMVYYGLGLNVQNLSGDIYLNFTIANTVELASYVVCIFLLDRVGRKILHCVFMLVGGLACIATIFPVLYGDSELDWVIILLAMIGKFGVSGAFGVIYMYTTELFPTVIRNSGLGISSIWARFGGMASPYIADLGVLIGGKLKVALPLIVFGGFAVAAGLLALTLPETLGKRLPETIEDAKQIKRRVTTSCNPVSNEHPDTMDLSKRNSLKSINNENI